MSKINTDSFYRRLEGAPYAVVGFFESVKAHFDRDNIVNCHFDERGISTIFVPTGCCGFRCAKGFGQGSGGARD